ncbi:hypothetical protein BD626DRAFT_568865 [Schizophyllum amplum]|uniref:Uncharacterized protein n=1 Tax=Schizophyllum amplum TaxID=97359 RepID=A0A550CFL0_9AGAR|nr:hypothetical protein BD626DRAFT_568865 [Auriculariopsis ampla]
MSATVSSSLESLNSSFTSARSSLGMYLRPSRFKRRRKESPGSLAYNPELDFEDQSSHSSQEIEESDTDPEEAVLPRTPPGHVHRFKKAPRALHNSLAVTQPGGKICPVMSIRRPGQVAHFVAQATVEDVLERFDLILGLEKGYFNLHCTSNVVYCSADIHHAMDAGFCLFLPSSDVLQAMRDAIRNFGVPPDREYEPRSQVNAAIPPETPRNSAGYVHHELVFGRHLSRPYRFIPLDCWPENRSIYRVTNVNADSGDYDVEFFRPPFVRNGELAMPEVDLHVDPYFVVWKAYVALTQRPSRTSRLPIMPGSEAMTAQLLVRKELDIVHEIGLFIEFLTLPAAFKMSPLRRDRINNELQSAEQDDDDEKDDYDQEEVSQEGDERTDDEYEGDEDEDDDHGDDEHEADTPAIGNDAHDSDESVSSDGSSDGIVGELHHSLLAAFKEVAPK